MKGKTKEELLEHYAKKEEAIPFNQFDCFVDKFDSIVIPDKDGMCLLSHLDYELMSGAWGVRVLARTDLKKETIIKALAKVIICLMNGSHNVEIRV